MFRPFASVQCFETFNPDYSSSLSNRVRGHRRKREVGTLGPSADRWEKAPLTPSEGRGTFGLSETLATVDRTDRRDEITEATIPIQVGPTATEANHDAARASDDFGSYFDEQAAPGARLPFAERIRLTAAVEVAAPGRACQRLGRHRLGGQRLVGRGIQGRRHRRQRRRW